MRVLNVQIGDNDLPIAVTAVIPIATAAWIAKTAGLMSPRDPMHDASEPAYDALVALVFNRYWENGVEGYLNGDEE